MKNLCSLRNQDLKDFFGSFDLILSDVHGVLWNILDTIPGTSEAVKSLQNIGKRFIVVSNNTLVTVDEFHKEIISKGFSLEKDDVVTPTLAMISYLKKQNFNKEVHVLGSPGLKKSLKEAGFQIAEDGPYETNLSLAAFSMMCSADDGRVGAVIADLDLNLNFINFQKALTFLKRDILFLGGLPESELHFGKDVVLMGAGPFHQILEERTGKTPIPMTKPGVGLNDYIVEKFNIKDPSRVLFIGDSIPSDMGFASKFGYQKLLVLTGSANENSLQTWNFPDEYRPEFYIDSLKTVHYLLQKLEKNR